MSRIKELRERDNISQIEFASRLGINPATVVRWEKTGKVPFTKAIEIAKEFNCTTEWIMGESSDELEGSVGKRLRKIRGELQITTTELAERINVTQALISTWEKTSKIPERSLRLISEKLHINLDWLKTGEGEMFSTAQFVQRTGTPKDLALIYGCDHRTAAFLERYVQLPDEERKQFNSTLSKLIFDKPTLDDIQRNNPR